MKTQQFTYPAHCFVERNYITHRSHLPAFEIDYCHSASSSSFICAAVISSAAHFHAFHSLFASAASSPPFISATVDLSESGFQTRPKETQTTPPRAEMKVVTALIKKRNLFPLPLCRISCFARLPPVYYFHKYLS